jgi:hypothetical protein
MKEMNPFNCSTAAGFLCAGPLQVHIMSEVRHPFSGLISRLLDTKRETVLITQDVNIPALGRDTPLFHTSTAGRRFLWAPGKKTADNSTRKLVTTVS